jgi:hypothetical protein
MMSRIRTAAALAFTITLSASADTTPDFSRCIQTMDLQPQGTREFIAEKKHPKTGKIISKQYDQKDLVVPAFHNGKPGLFFASGSGIQFIDLSPFAITQLPAQKLTDGRELPPVKVNPKNGIRIPDIKIQFKVPGKFGGEREVALSLGNFRYFPLEGGRIEAPLDFTVRDGSKLPTANLPLMTIGGGVTGVLGAYIPVKPEAAPTTAAASVVDK